MLPTSDLLNCDSPRSRHPSCSKARRMPPARGDCCSLPTMLSRAALTGQDAAPRLCCSLLWEHSADPGGLSRPLAAAPRPAKLQELRGRPSSLRGREQKAAAKRATFATPRREAGEQHRAPSSRHGRGSNPRSSVYETDALPLGHRACVEKAA